VSLPDPNVDQASLSREERDARSKFDREQQVILDEQRVLWMQSALQGGKRVFVILPQRSQGDLRRMVPGNVPLVVANGGKAMATFQNTWPNPITPNRAGGWPPRPPRRQDAPPPKVDLRTNFYFIYEIVEKPAKPTKGKP
ncbi:MAG: hypothetical protein HC898_03180, partial [Phycisphaerales bacterium]|nr:hypothetical protein [Phycisphaerales bacterium]